MLTRLSLGLIESVGEDDAALAAVGFVMTSGGYTRDHNGKSDHGRHDHPHPNHDTEPHDHSH
jgi:hypothetical protein